MKHKLETILTAFWLDGFAGKFVPRKNMPKSPFQVVFIIGKFSNKTRRCARTALFAHERQMGKEETGKNPHSVYSKRYKKPIRLS